jgi:hypothetical protein
VDVPVAGGKAVTDAKLDGSVVAVVTIPAEGVACAHGRAGDIDNFRTRGDDGISVAGRN